MATYTWTGAVDENFNNPNNWDPIGVPKSAEEIKTVEPSFGYFHQAFRPKTLIEQQEEERKVLNRDVRIFLPLTKWEDTTKEILRLRNDNRELIKERDDALRLAGQTAEINAQLMEGERFYLLTPEGEDPNKLKRGNYQTPSQQGGSDACPVQKEE